MSEESIKWLRRLLLPTLILLGMGRAEVPTFESVTRLYVATFNRAPDAGGIGYWLHDSFSGHPQLEQIAQSFFDQPETKERYPDPDDYDSFIPAVYRNLFNREPDPKGFDYWKNELKSHRILKSQFILAVINGALAPTGDPDDAKTLQNKTAVGLAFARAGLDDVDLAKQVMEGVTADDATVEAALLSIRHNRTEKFRASSPSILSLETTIGGRSFEKALSPGQMAVLDLAGLSRSDVVVGVDTAKGRRTITPRQVALGKQTIEFSAPNDIVDGYLSLEGKGIYRELAYRTVTMQTPYIESLSSDTVFPGETITITGKNLPNIPVGIVLPNEKGGKLSLVATPDDDRISFSVPGDAVSGMIYLHIGSIKSNSLFLTVKRSVNVTLNSLSSLPVTPTQVSLIREMQEYTLNEAGQTTIPVENRKLQYLASVATMEDGSYVPLYEGVVLPIMEGNITLDADSTAIAWVMMGLGVFEKNPDKIDQLYAQIYHDGAVLELGHYIDSLIKSDFQAWADRSDPTLQEKLIAALTSVMQKSPAPLYEQDRALDGSSNENVTVIQTPENGNIYIDKDSLKHGSATLINDTKLYLSVEVKSREKKHKGQIVNGYSHVEDAIITNGGTLVGPQGWGLLDIASSQTFDLEGEDSHFEIVTPGYLGTTDKPVLSDSLRTRVVIEGYDIPVLNLLLQPLIGKELPSGSTNRFIEGMKLLYINGDFLKQLRTEVSNQDSSLAAIADTFLYKPIVNGLKGCLQPEVSDICKHTVSGLARMFGLQGSADALKDYFIQRLQSTAAKEALEKSITLVPGIGWVTRAAILAYNNIGTVSNSSIFLKTWWDLHHNPKEINVDIEFPFAVNKVKPLCVIPWGQTSQVFQIGGTGLVSVDGTMPEAYILTNDGKLNASSIDLPSTGTDMLATFDKSALLPGESGYGSFFVKNFGYSVLYDKMIRLVSANDTKLFIDSISPDHAAIGKNVTLRGCGWSATGVHIVFPGDNGPVKAKIVSQKPEELVFSIPENARSGLVHLRSDQGKDESFFFEVDRFMLYGNPQGTFDGHTLSLEGIGLDRVVTVYVEDSAGKAYDLSPDTTQSSYLTLENLPSDLTPGRIDLYAEWDDGTRSNTVQIFKLPSPPKFEPSSGAIDENTQITLSSPDPEAAIYYSINGSEPILYTGPITLTQSATLSAFTRMEVQSKNYDSQTASAHFDVCKVDEELLGGICIPKESPAWSNWPNPEYCPSTYEKEALSLAFNEDGTTHPMDPCPLEKTAECFKDYVACYYENNQLSEEIIYHDYYKTGIEKSYYPSGVLELEIPRYHSDVDYKCGMYKYYLETGILKDEVPYNCNGKKNGIEKKYYNTGEIEALIPYKNGLVDGKVRTYYQNGALQKEIPYNNGKRDGCARMYYENGNLEAELEWKNDQMVGTEKWYYENGEFSHIIPYKNGKINGMEKYFYKNGLLSAKIPWVAGDMNGTATHFYDDGRVKSEVTYIQGKKNGPEKDYYKNGTIESEIYWLNDKKNGIQKNYYESGKLMEEIPWKNDIVDGIKRTYYYSGQLQCEENYSQGNLNGSTTCYTEKGCTSYTAEYENGQLLSSQTYDCNDENTSE